MKSLTQYIYESQKTFEFCVKLARIDLDEAKIAQIKSALETYAVESVSKPKRLPIQEHRDFPGLGACECHLLNVVVKYPVTTDQLVHTLSERAQIDVCCVNVRTKHEYEQTEHAEALGKDHEGALLTDPELKDVPDAQELVGQNRIGSMLKELESRKYEFASKEVNSNKDKEIPMNTSSPVGSRQNKIPSPVKGK
jgi:hypothetical protein